MAIDKDQIQTFFDKFELQTTILSNCTQLYKTLSTQFTFLEESFVEKSKTLDTKFETLETDTKQALEALEHRENSIPEDESNAIARVEELKQASLLEFEKQKGGNGEVLDFLKTLCRKMDCVGLIRFTMLKRKETGAFKYEVGVAISECVDPANLVLDALDDFIAHKNVKVGGSDRRWACATLLQALLPENKRFGFAKSVEERAGVIAETWKTMIDEKDSRELGAAEAGMFLQFVVGFGLRSRFEDEYLKKLVVEYTNKREVPKLAASLWVGDQMADIIDELVKKGKEIEAVCFAYEANLIGRFLPVPLLKAHLKNARKSVSAILKDGHYSVSATEEAGYLELNAHKAIIRCVEDYKLEKEFPLESSRKRISQLEKAKIERKKSTAPTNKPQNKRPRGVGGGPFGFNSPKVGRTSNAYRGNIVSPHQSAAARYAGTSAYDYSSHPIYRHSPSASYVPQRYSQSSPTLPQHYSQAQEDIMGVGGATTRATTSYGVQASYGAYDYNTTFAPGTVPDTSTYHSSYPQ
ncbi:hypothetical protein GIB67_003964 [Kingdonia uniflora]|uniref:FRIGIDA-like protein n=1 Tax=Kingdonia uniflora TaxID=39325 RepID=A0A7J7NQY7_9MAGN|nr:hypothetical protein GIB67_003964 [Kingdonia uniflora]